MSSHGAFGLEIRILATLIKSLVDLGKEYHNISSMRTTDGKIFKVDMVTTDENGRVIGFQKTEKGEYRIIADCAGLSAAQQKSQDEFVKRIRQRYSYNRVIDELKAQGYVIAEEEKVKNNTIRLVARKWA